MGNRATATSFKGSVRLGTYLRKLRSGYGYSLRRVEERARAEGGEIDNSQLSRYEKGICYPSFDKLRILASVFNVSIQSFSDVVDLEAFEDLKPNDLEPGVVIDGGLAALRAGDNGLAFAHFERALELLHALPAGVKKSKLVARARINQASALSRLGKLALAEHQLRSALRHAEHLSPELRCNALLALANIHADQGDSFLSEIESERAIAIAREAQLPRVAAMALHTMARVLYERGQAGEAIPKYREACELYAESGEQHEALRVRINVGACYVSLGKVREGIRMLRACLDEVRDSNRRRLEAQIWSSLGEAYYRQKDNKMARRCLRESNARAMYNEERQPDLLFFNAFYDWKMAREDQNPTREKIAFGRLKVLRSGLERRLPEADVFDDLVERGRCNA